MGAAYTAVNTKITGCPDLEPYGFNAATCNAKIAACTSGDLAALSTAEECLGNLPACTTSTEVQWFQSFDACQAAAGVAADCAAAVTPCSGADGGSC